MVDLQSGLRAVSGGVDFAYGLLEGVRFGRQELVGVLSDMDATGEDALRHRLVFLEDARRDVASITVPITWIHGRHDAWMDIDRAVDLLSSGDSSRRSLIEIPTGHQLRSSAEALETFQLIALEVGRIALGRALKPMPPDPVELEFASRSERGRRPQLAFDARSFWRDYLLGRARDVGFQLLTATSAYQRLMGDQIELLGLKPGSTVLDLGSGTGELAARLADCGGDSKPIRVVEIDLVPEALARSRARLEAHSAALPVVRVVADLELGPRSLPVRRSYADAALLSLVISYVTDPLALLACTLQSLRSGGRVVVSTMKPDADISALYVEGIAELPRDRVEHLFGREVSDHFEVLQREFLNSAAHLLDLEQDGRFRFYPSHELCALVQAAGFVDVETTHAFGEPAQAVVVFARKP
jgi:SAM-dependent methyltransferase